MDDFRERLTAYQTAMSLARNMLRQGIISEDDYRKIDTIVAKKHRVSSCSIFPVSYTHLTLPTIA